MMKQYTIYFDPRDYPDKYVVREWIIDGGAEPVPGKILYIGLSLHGARMAIPYGHVRIPRFDDDVKSIVEVWV